MSITFAEIPLDRRIAFKREIADKRRTWLETAHRRNPRCHYCGNKTTIMPRNYNQQMRHHEEFVATLDHALPQALGGGESKSNYRLACAICNSLKGSMSEQDFIRELEIAGVRT